MRHHCPAAHARPWPSARRHTAGFTVGRPAAAAAARAQRRPAVGEADRGAAPGHSRVCVPSCLQRIAATPCAWQHALRGVRGGGPARCHAQAQRMEWRLAAALPWVLPARKCACMSSPAACSACWSAWWWACYGVGVGCRNLPPPCAWPQCCEAVVFSLMFALLDCLGCLNVLRVYVLSPSEVVSPDSVLQSLLGQSVAG